MGHARSEVDGEEGFGAHEVDMTDKVVVAAEVGDGGADFVGELGEDANELAFFSIDEVAQFVVGGEHLGRLDEDRLAGGRLVVDEPLEAAFELRLHGDAEPSVADGHLGILLGDTVLLGLHQQFADAVVGIVGDADDGALDAP